MVETIKVESSLKATKKKENSSSRRSVLLSFKIADNLRLVGIHCLPKKSKGLR